MLFNVRDRQLAGLQDYLAQFAEVPAPVVERNQPSPSGLRGSLHRLQQIKSGQRTMEIVPVPDVAQRAKKAPVPHTVVDLAFDPAFAVVEKFDQQVEQVHGFAALWASRGMIAAPDLRVIPHHIIRAGAPLHAFRSRAFRFESGPSSESGPGQQHDTEENPAQTRPAEGDPYSGTLSSLPSRRSLPPTSRPVPVYSSYLTTVIAVLIGDRPVSTGNSLDLEAASLHGATTKEPNPRTIVSSRLR